MVTPWSRGKIKLNNLETRNSISLFLPPDKKSEGGYTVDPQEELKFNFQKEALAATM